MKYVDYINQLIREEIGKREKVVLFGQNIAAGSCLGGLTKNLKVDEKSLVINTQNSENSLCGIGFGMMINGVSSVYFMKQLDFLLLGLDHLVNTYNFIRRKNPLVSFTIMPIIVDCGYQGMQSSLNNLGDFCSIARVEGFALTNKADSQEIINSQLFAPGFRIIGVSQRLFKEEILDIEKKYSNKENTVFQYSEGKSATVVCFNFSLPYGWELFKKAREKGIGISLFSVNSFNHTDWDYVLDNLRETKNLVILDDSKSENLLCHQFLIEAKKERLSKIIVVKKEMGQDWLSPISDILEIDYDNIINLLKP
jgi:acetoin:2,6-dichlorophenolindophenol oxidoreductase subunit beta